MDHTHSLTVTITQLQPRGAKRQLSYYFSVQAQSFHVSVIHRTLTWTTGSLSCIRDHSRDHSYAAISLTLTSDEKVADLKYLNMGHFSEMIHLDLGIFLTCSE